MSSVNASRDINKRALQLRIWWEESALPAWYRHGIDWKQGGYYETLSHCDGCLLGEGDVRRGRVVARQIYVFDLARRFSATPFMNELWTNAFEHGMAFLLGRLYGGAGMFDSAFDVARAEQIPAFSLYEHAFYLFALARAVSGGKQSYRLERIASDTLLYLRREYAHEAGGYFEEEGDLRLFRANPHMHLLEAAIEWIMASPLNHLRWVSVAKEIVGLALSYFMDAESGVLHEHFGPDWKPLADDDGQFFEPGHHFEWAWLLLKWAELGLDSPAVLEHCRSAAVRLVDVAESRGVDTERNVAVNEVWDSFALKDPYAKVWPQTERIKAWCAMASMATSPEAVAAACNNICLAIDGLTQYFRADAPGLWHELLLPMQTAATEGVVKTKAGGRTLKFRDEPCKASSFYHIVGAIESVLLYDQKNFAIEHRASAVPANAYRQQTL